MKTLTISTCFAFLVLTIVTFMVTAEPQMQDMSIVSPDIARDALTTTVSDPGSCDPMNPECDYTIKEVWLTTLYWLMCDKWHAIEYHSRSEPRLTNMAWCQKHSSEPSDYQTENWACCTVEHSDSENDVGD